MNAEDKNNQPYTCPMHPHVKSNATRSNTFKDAQKNSEKYLIQDDNTSNETLTIEDIFKGLTKGRK